MRKKYRLNYKLKIMLYTIISSLITIGLCTLFLFICVRLNFLTLSYSSYSSVAVDEKTQYAANAMLSEGDFFYKILGVGIRWQLIVLYIIIGIILFSVIFVFLTRNLSTYVSRVVVGIGKIADGEYEDKIPIEHDDEFSFIASRINQLGDNIKEMRDTAYNAELTKNELITNVAHDLRTPLTSIIGYIDLAEQTDDEEKRSQFLEIAHGKAVKLNKLIEELFSFSKISFSKEPLVMQELDLVQLLKQEIDELYPVFEESGLVCNFKYDSENVMIRADGERIMRVFDNLFSNAVRYGADGKQINVNLTTRQDMVEVRVINYGSIIPKENLPYLFEKFYKVDNSRTGENKGTGLGLPIAKAIVESHNGSITADSDINGTVFTVSLPVSQ